MSSSAIHLSESTPEQLPAPWLRLGRLLSERRRLPVVFGVIHAGVDAACALSVLGAVMLHRVSPSLGFYLVVAYNLLAFAGQAPAGALTDWLRRPRGAILLGLVLTAGATLTLTIDPVTTTILAGVGNAFFHVGAGAITLRLDPDRATAPGIYVAPGALGLALGVWLGRSGSTLAWPFTIVLALSIGATLLIAVPSGTYEEPQAKKAPSRAATLPHRRIPYAGLIIALLLVSIVVRSLLGFAGAHEVPREPLVMFGLATAAFGGKALGGIISDRLGWLETSVGALLLSAPLLAFGGPEAALVIVGMLLFQMTMPVTLSAISLVLPGRPGFAFGIACVALILGALPTFNSSITRFYGPPLFLCLVVLSAGSVFAGLRLMGKLNPARGLLTRSPA